MAIYAYTYWMIKRLPILGLMVFWGLMVGVMPGFGKAPVVRAEVDRTEMAPGETLSLTVTIGGTAGRIDVSGIRDFEVLSTRSTQNYSIINGKTSREVRYIYTLVPRETGRLLIPPLPVTSGGDTFYTEMIAVQVRRHEGDSGVDSLQDVFARVKVSDETPYIGQQIVCRVGLYHAVRIGNAELREGPVFEGFDARKLDESRSYAKIIGERRYDVTELVYILTPEQAGTFQVGDARIMCEVVTQVPRRSGFPFNSFFSDTRMVPRMIPADPVKVRVNSLPAYSGKGDFSGLVGIFDISAGVDRTTIAEGDSCNLSVVIKGRGNIQDAPMPDLTLPGAFKVYQDEPVDDINTTEQGVAGSRQYALALVALSPGDYSIGPLSLTYFDPEQELYITRTTRLFEIRVNKKPGSVGMNVYDGKNGAGETGVQKRAVDFTGKDIFSVKSGLAALTHNENISPVSFVLMLMLPYLLMGILTVVYSRRQQAEPPSKIMARQAKAAMKAAGKNQSHAAAVDHLYRAMIYAIYAKAEKQGEAITRREAADMLAQKGCDADLTDTVNHLLERIESVKFGGIALDVKTMEDLQASVSRMMRRLIP